MAVAVVVLLVVGIVFALQDARRPPAQPPGTQPGVVATPTTVPSAPPTDYRPSRDVTLPPLPSVPASLCPSVTLKHPITVLAFNIHGAEGHGGRIDMARIAREINVWDPDIALLQEVDDGRQRSGFVRQAEVLGKATKRDWVYGGNQMAGSGPIGNAILTKYPVVAWKNVRLPRIDGREQRGALHAVLDVEGTEISVYSTHLDHRGRRDRIAGAQAIVRAARADKRPTIVGGDFNIPPEGRPIQIMRAAGFGDVWSVGEGFGGTVPARSPRRRIDYILHDGWFAPIQAMVLVSAISDHRAVWTRIELREEIGCIKVGG